MDERHAPPLILRDATMGTAPAHAQGVPTALSDITGPAAS